MTTVSAPVFSDWPFDATEARNRQQQTAQAIGKPTEKKFEFTYEISEGWIFRKTRTVSCSLSFVLIPAGEFMMGSPVDEPERRDNEGPLHRVRISRPFYLSTTVVTRDFYRAVSGSPLEGREAGNAPARGLSWQDWQVFLRDFSSREFVQARFPTEAEWEYACRAGAETRFSCGDEEIALEACALVARDSLLDLSVAQKAPNAWGLYDMHGLCWEYCSDWFDASYYKSQPATEIWVDPTGPRQGTQRVIRGGDATSPIGQCRCAFRKGAVQAGKSLKTPFSARIVLTI